MDFWIITLSAQKTDGATSVLYTAPHVLPDYPESRWVTNRHMVRLPDSAGLHQNKSWLLSREGDPVESTGLRQTVLDWTLLESKMAVESKEVCPVEFAGLVHFQEKYNIHIRYMLVDCAGLCRTGLHESARQDSDAPGPWETGPGFLLGTLTR